MAKSSPLCSWERITTNVGFKDKRKMRTGLECMYWLLVMLVSLFRDASVQLRFCKMFALKLESGVLIAGCSSFCSSS